MITASLAYAILSRDPQASLDRVAKQSTVQKDAQYYADNINKVKDVDDFLDNYRLYSYAMKAYGLEDMTYAKAFMKKVLESDLTDPDSYANKLSDGRYRDFAAAFNFNAPPNDVQTDDQEDDLIGLYKQSFEDQADAATAESNYYDLNIGDVKTVSDLVNNTRLREYVLKAFDIDTTYASKSYLTEVLTSDYSTLAGDLPEPPDVPDPTKTYVGDKYLALAAQFNFKPDNGDTDYYTATIGSVTSVSDLVGDTRLRDYALQAAGIDPSTVDDAFLTHVLTADPSTLGGDPPLPPATPDPSVEYVGAKYLQLRSYFNFNADGSVNGAAQSQDQLDTVTAMHTLNAPIVGSVQTDAQKSAVMENYTLKAQTLVKDNSVGSDVVYVTKAAADYNKAYFTSHIGSITNVDDLVADPRLTSYIKAAFSMGSDFTDSALRQVLTDPTYANLMGFGAVYSAFNIKSDGSISTTVRAQTLDQVASMLSGQANIQTYYTGMIRPPDGSQSVIQDVDSLLSNQIVTSYIKDAYGLGWDFSNTELRQILTDPDYAAASGHTDLHDAFNFQADGSVSGGFAQTAEQYNATVAKAGQSVSRYQVSVGDFTDVDDMLADSAANSFIRMSLQISDSVSDATLRDILTDPAEAANQGYADVYDLFAFESDGSLATMHTSQTAAQLAAVSTKLDDAQTYYGSVIQTITSVNQLLADTKLNSYIRNAYGIPPSLTDADLRSILTDQSGTGPYADISAAFNFKADGTLDDGLTAQTQEQIADARFNTQTNVADYKDRIGSAANVDELLSDDGLLNVIKSAFGLAYDMPTSTLRSILTDPAYAAGAGYADLNAAFNFAADGSLPAVSSIQTAEQSQLTTDNYGARYDDEQADVIDKVIDNYKTRMDDDPQVENINDFMRSNDTADSLFGNDDLPDLYEVALQAYGLTTNDVSRSEMRKLLASDPYDPNGYVASFKDDRITSMIRAFNFTSEGEAGPGFAALSPATMARYATDYKARVLMDMKDGPVKDKASKDATSEVDYFSKGMAKVKSLDDFLADDRLTGLVLTANGLDPKDYDKATLKKIFTSDPEDEKSYLNTEADAKFKDIVADFNFDKDGDLTRDKVGTIQDKAATDRTQKLYLQQTLETQEGETNDGVRLALYFQRKAPDITSIYTILGDKALYQVVTTAYSLPAQISSMDVDKQVDLLNRFVSLDDLQDPKKVDKLLRRFTAMYDVQNNTQQSPALQILTGGGTQQAQ